MRQPLRLPRALSRPSHHTGRSRSRGARVKSRPMPQPPGGGQVRRAWTLPPRAREGTAACRPSVRLSSCPTARVMQRPYRQRVARAAANRKDSFRFRRSAARRSPDSRRGALAGPGYPVAPPPLPRSNDAAGRRPPRKSGIPRYKSSAYNVLHDSSAPAPPGHHPKSGRDTLGTAFATPHARVGESDLAPPQVSLIRKQSKETQ